MEDLQIKIKKLELEIERLKKKISKLEKENKEIKNKNQQHNERGAGRKSKFSKQEKEIIKMYRIQGNTMQEIATMFNCSVSLIYNILKDSI